MDHQTTEGSTHAKERTKSHGDPQIGNGNVSCSCPARFVAAGVSGVVISLPWSAIRELSKSIDPKICTLTSERQAVTLCACRVTMPKEREWCCVLDAENKAIMYLPGLTGRVMVRYAGLVNQPTNENGSYFAGIKKDESVVHRAEATMDALTRIKKSLEKTENGSPSHDDTKKPCPKCGKTMYLIWSEIPDPWDPDVYVCENPKCQYKEKK